MEHAGRLAEIAAEEGEPHAVATLRIDELAGINAEDGYAAGDHLLRQVGSLIGRLTRGEDLAARIGGGRFAVLMPGTDQADAVTALNRVSAILRTTRFIVPGTGRTLQIDPVGRVTALGQSESLEPVLNGLFDGGTV
jgi:diguanylate cyclase (GGDEF)-like protein